MFRLVIRITNRFELDQFEITTDRPLIINSTPTISYLSSDLTIGNADILQTTEFDDVWVQPGIISYDVPCRDVTRLLWL